MPIINRSKCVLLGDTCVGKSSIVKALVGHPYSFTMKYTMTPGVEIFTKSIRPPNTDFSLELFIYDFSGRVIYRDLVRKLWGNNTTLVVGVFDVCREESFYNLQGQLNEFQKGQSATGKEELMGIILGNKTDQRGRRIITSDDAHQLAKKYKMRYFDVSAKEDRASIEESFLYMTTLWMENKMIPSS